MERPDNGAALLAVSVDVNDNEEKSRRRGCRAETPSPGLKNGQDPAGAGDPPSPLPEKGFVYVAAGRNVNQDRAALPAVRGGERRTLDLVTECLPGGLEDSCVSDGTLNGFTESSEQLMPGSGVRGGGGRGSPSCPSTAARRRGAGEGVRGCRGVTEGCASDTPDKGHLDPEAGPKPAVLLSSSCDGELRQHCARTASPAAEMKLTNGDVGCVAQGDRCSGRTEPFSVGPLGVVDAGENQVKLANGGLLIVNKGDLLRVRADLHGSQGGDPASDMQLRNTSPASAPCNKVSCEGRETSGSAAVDPDSVSPEPPQLDEASAKAEIPPRPVTLRTSRNTTVSLSCDATPVSPEDGPLSCGAEAGHDRRFMDVSLSSRNTFEVSRRQSAPDNLPEGLTLPADPTADQALKPKKLGISDFFSRSLFSRKAKEPRIPSQSAPGWKLFGKVPLRENPPKDSKTIQQEYEARTGKAANPPAQPGRRKNLEFEPLSTTALILEDRPANLPAKSTEEAQRHRQEYDEMVAEAKKREMKEAQKKKKIMKERYKQEEIIANAMVIWNTEILPNWETMRNTRKVRDLWWQGLPPSVRGKVWSLAIGNELNITPELYEIFLSRAKERWKSFSETGSENEAEDSVASLADRESSLDLIKLDISRTFPSLFIFQKGGPYHDLLHSVLGAYTCYRPDVGYVQGMSFIAAVLILNLEEADAFIAFANLLNKPCQMAFFRVDHDLMLKYFAAFEVFFEENLPRLFAHFQSYNLTPDLYLIDWIFTLYSKSLPLDLACRVWDAFCRDGEEFLFRTGLGILKLYEDILLQMDFIHIAQFLTRLPEDIVSEKLFGCIAAVQMLSSNKKWVQVFTALMKDNKEVDKNNSPPLKS
ncbi:TBC1 domain family member 12 isoform X2 [Amia ocellicauda]|uniref:TBC1 domain family member 12 isoform X2 n=1 Tax=Amia ocellicauda TaxID=2972642 RepID=UPI0034641434